MTVKINKNHMLTNILHLILLLLVTERIIEEIGNILIISNKIGKILSLPLCKT